MIGVTSYAHALKEALLGKTPEEQKLIVEGFFSALETRGQSMLLPRIVSEIEKHEQGYGEKVVITYAEAKDKDRFAAEVEKDLKELGSEIKESKILEREDSSLIGGYRIETEQFLLDRTYKKALSEMYQTLST